MEKKDKVSAAVVLASIAKKATPIKTALARIKIKDKNSYELKRQKVEDLKELKKLAEEKEKSFLEPLDKLRANIVELFAPFKSMVIEREKEAKQEMLVYNKNVKAKQLKVKNDLQSGKIVNLSTATKKLAELEVGGGERKIWTLEEVDASKTPREYLVPDESAIKIALKDGKTVSGWKLVQKETIAI